MKVILDCNIIVTSLSSRSKYFLIFSSLFEEKFQLLISSEIMLEYEEIVQKKFGERVAKDFIITLSTLENVKFVESSFRWNLIYDDPDDNKYTDCYLAGFADFLVTEDKHFGVLAQTNFPAINVVKITEFLDLLKR